jgi:hypothetical protein
MEKINVVRLKTAYKLIDTAIKTKTSLVIVGTNEVLIGILKYCATKDFRIYNHIRTIELGEVPGGLLIHVESQPTPSVKWIDLECFHDGHLKRGFGVDTYIEVIGPPKIILKNRYEQQKD